MKSTPKPAPPVKPAPKPETPKEPIPGPAVKSDAVKPEPPAPEQKKAEQKGKQATKPVPEIVSSEPVADKKPLPIRPPEPREIKPSKAETSIRPQTPSEAPRPAPAVSKKEFPRRPDLKIVKDVAVPPPSRVDKTGRVEAEKPKKKGGKPPVEVRWGKSWRRARRP